MRSRLWSSLALLVFSTLPDGADAFDLDAWLANNRPIADAIVWHRNPDGQAVKYTAWDQAQKADLAEAVRKLRAWEPLGLPDAPPSVNTLYNDGTVHSMRLLEETAWRIYVAHVAQSLSVEIEGWVPWSLADFRAEELEPLLDSRSLFEWLDPDYAIVGMHDYSQWDMYTHGVGTPGDPRRTFEFLREGGFLGQTPRETIGRLLDWSRDNLVHYEGDTTPANLQDHWQYEGYPPVERVLGGTEHPQYGFAHWTAGCWGTTAFLRAVLRTANIPVKLVRRCDHAMPYFVREGRYLTHGDDPYNLMSRLAPVPPGEDLLVDQGQFDGWLGDCKNVGIRPYELVVERLPDALLKEYCSDLEAGRGHADGNVLNGGPYLYGGLQDHYTVQELEAANLWGRLDAKVQALGGCPRVMALGAHDAVFDLQLLAPTCGTVGFSCDSGGLLIGRGGLGPEAHAPNTIYNSCADGVSGAYQNDESVERIKVSSLTGGDFAPWENVRVEVTVWAWAGNPGMDKLDLYFAADARNPNWTFVTTLTPNAGGLQTLSATYRLPVGKLQAIRAQFRYGGNASACATGSYDDHDDLAFAVR